jgi:hypothetical protein
MSRHTTYRGATIDMDNMRRDNEKVPALGNMSVNAKGDQLGRAGSIAKTADQIARENHRVQSQIVHTGLKGEVPASPETPVPAATALPKSAGKKTVEKELPNGDISIEEA